ncbi:MAG: sensor histidine kinase [Hyphomicrobium sp.]|nr:MAG: sensor histidine kinase [Hyphomicrobium sp.]PPC98305.1 MAG: sensor histidine kinase [Hyphomicrobium sp.]
MDLKWLLVRRITLVAFACFFAGSGLALYMSAREAHLQNQVLAELAGRQLELQLSRIERGTDTLKRFPDWDLISNYALKPGQCVQFDGLDPARNRSSCSGLEANFITPPAWFSEFYGRFLNRHLSGSRLLTYRGEVQGAISTSFDPYATSSKAWTNISPLLGLSALLVGALCLVTYIIVDRSLRPASNILTGLNRLAEGDLKVRLPPFQLAELNRISQVFNAMTEDLEKATKERADFAHRLVDMQEQERRHLARELHDEIAQRLAAIGAMAACIRNSAQADAPQLVGEARELEKMASNLMFALRRTLRYLRPQEIDDLGLVASLRALVEHHNENARGRTIFSIEAADEFESLRSETSAHVYRIVQEALTNAAKHARARTVKVRMSEHSDSVRKHVRLSVIDDGVGQHEDVNLDRMSGSGLIGMRERVTALCGTLTAGPLPVGGFGLHVEFPSSPQGA